MNKIQETLTKIMYIKLRGAKFIGIKNVKIPHIGNIEVMVLRMKGWIFDAQTTIFRTIIVEESLFGESKHIQNRVLTHEYMHKKRLLLFIFLAIMMLVSGLVAVQSLMLLILSIVLSIIKLNQSYIFYSVIGLFGLVIGLLFFISSSWILELKAEFDTMDILGKNILIKKIERGKKRKSKEPIIHIIIYRLTHPPDGLTLKLYDFFKK